MRRTLSGILTALILTTAAPAAAPALPVLAAPYVKAGQTSSFVAVSKETVDFVKKGGMTYCLTAEGVKKTGWVKKAGKWYYFDKKDGHMLTGWLSLKTRKFYLKGDGSMVQGPCWYNVSGKRYYFTANGHVRSAWEKIGGKWYFRNTDGQIVKNKWVLYGGKYYYAFFDLKDMLREAGATEEDLALLQRALDQALVYEAHTARFIDVKLERCCGLATYLPAYPDYRRDTWHGTEFLDGFYKSNVSWNDATGLVE